MRCVICRQAETKAGRATVTLEHGTTTLVIRGVPAQVCPNCGEEYVGEKLAAELIAAAEKASQSGIQVDVREYVAA